MCWFGFIDGSGGSASSVVPLVPLYPRQSVHSLLRLHLLSSS